LKLNLKAFGEEHPDVAVIWNNLGAAWDEKGEHDKAIGFFEKSLKSNLKTFGKEHPVVGRDYNNIGTAWTAKGKYNLALGFFEKSLKIVKEAGLSHRAKTVKENIDDLMRKKEED
jgi:tetratricopeptide (TPR) repeat protein